MICRQPRDPTTLSTAEQPFIAGTRATHLLIPVSGVSFVRKASAKRLFKMLTAEWERSQQPRPVVAPRARNCTAVVYPSFGDAVVPSSGDATPVADVAVSFPQRFLDGSAPWWRAEPFRLSLPPLPFLLGVFVCTRVASSLMRQLSFGDAGRHHGLGTCCWRRRSAPRERTVRFDACRVRRHL